MFFFFIKLCNIVFQRPECVLRMCFMPVDTLLVTSVPMVFVRSE
jgi:hypothetical protein